MLLFNHELIPELRNKLRSQQSFLRNNIEFIPLDSLKFKPGKEEWSVLECIEHLNLQLDWYIPRIRKKIHLRKVKTGDSYSTGFFGDRMVSSMEPDQGEVRYPMKTFRNFNPSRSPREGKKVIDQFKWYLDELDKALVDSVDLDLGKIRVRSAIGSILRFKLGDCYRFILAHNERHLLQCKKALKVLSTYQ